MDEITVDKFMETRTKDFAKRLWRNGNHGNFVTIPNGGSPTTEWVDPTGFELPNLDSGQNVYLSVNPTSRIPAFNKHGEPVSKSAVRTRKDTVAGLNALYAEFDTNDKFKDKANIKAHLKGLPLSPSAIIDSGGGYHCYWFLDKTFEIKSDDDLNRAQELQAGWVIFVGGDPGAKDLARILRVPGSRNVKPEYGKDGAPVEFKKLNLNQTYSIRELEALLPARKSPLKTGKVSREVPFKDALAAMDELFKERCEDRQQWLEVGMALTEFDEAGFQVWNDWSQQSEKYDGETIRETWDSLEPDKEGITARSLLYWAKKDTDWKPNESLVEEELLDFTELGNAYLFISQYQDRLTYTAERGWMVFKNGFWNDGAKTDAQKFAQESAQSIYQKAADSKDKMDARAWGDWAKESLFKYRIKNALELAQPHLTKKIKEFDTHTELLNLENGTLNLTTKKLMKHDPGFMLTQQAEMRYDPTAKCPEWEKAMELIFQGDKETILYIKAALGWSLGGRTDIKAGFFMYGPSGENGKSTIVQTMLKLFGTYGLKTDINAVMKTGRALTPQKAQFKGKRFVVGSEIATGQKLDAALWKDLTGNDDISVERKYLDPYSFSPRHKLWMYGNEKPDIEDGDDATWQRIKGIPFKYKIPREKQQRMDDLIRTFLSESSGILNWLLEGYEMAAEQKWLTDREPEAMIEFVKEYRLESDPLAQFIAEKCEVGKGSRVDKREFIRVYNNYRVLADVRVETAHKITKAMAKGDFGRSANGKFYQGLSWK